MRFLNNVDLNLYELQNFKVHPLAADPSGVLSQLYYNTGSDKLRVYTSTGWKDVDSGSMATWLLAGDSGSTQTITDGETVSIDGSTFIDTVASAGNVLTISLSASGSANSGTYLRGDNTWAALPAGYAGWTLAGDSGTPQTISSGNTATIAGGTALSSVASATDTVTINHDNFGTAGTYAYPTSITTNAQGHITSITSGSAWGTMSSFSVSADTGTSQTITDGNTLNIAGSVGIDTVASATDVITINLDLNELSTSTSYTKASDYLVIVDGGANAKILTSNIPISSFGTATEAINMGNYKVTNLAEPTLSDDAATKGYVDNALIGGLQYQGGYNAATNTPDLDTSPSGSIKQGWVYTVTADGTFFTEQVRTGDMLIAEVNAPTTLADWTVVQSNIDLATTTTAGIASFAAADFNVVAGAVSIKNVNLGSQTTGNYVATISTGTGLNGSGSSEGAAVSLSLDLNELSVGTNATHIAGNDGSGNTRKFEIGELGDDIFGARTYSASIGDGTNTDYVVTHSLGTRDVIVQLFDNSTFDTVYADVVRTSTSAVTITFGAAPSTNDIRVLITKII